MQIVPVVHYGANLRTWQPALLEVGPLAVELGGMVAKAADGAVEFIYRGEDPLHIREQIARLANDMLALPDQREMPVTHEFVDGMYIRRLFIQKGTLLVGKIHKKQCINVVERGDIAILTETGAKRVKAGFTIVSPAGLQKVGYANEDTVFTNIFRTDVTDPDKVEAELIWESFDAMERLLEGGQ